MCDNFYCMYVGGVSVGIMQVVLSAAHNCFFCEMQFAVSDIAM